MKLLNAKQIHDWDAYTIQHQNISSVDLMERAAIACVDYIFQNDVYDKTFKIFCGKGNNGGDGLVIARLLLQKNINVSVFIIEFGAVGTDDFQSNLQRLHQLTKSIHFIQSKEFFPAINKDEIVIDALFGSGLNRPLKDLSASLIEHINQSKTNIISIDVPSGMFLDKSSKGNAIINATTTLTFQTLKLCFFVTENADFFGDVKVLDINLDATFSNTISSSLNIIEESDIKNIFKPRKPFTNKGSFGHALIIAGNKGKMGAALMATHACIRAGAGLTTLNVPEDFLNTVHSTSPEAMCQIREKGLDFEKINAVGIGPGLGKEKDAEDLVHESLQKFDKPMVIDADALNIISTHKDWLKETKNDSILTPHPKEFERLFGEAENDFERIDMALIQSTKNNFIIVLKGRYTLIAKNGEGWFNTAGNSGLAKGGSGDILTGIITALLAQKYEPLNAALLGVHLHSVAADLSLKNQSMESLTATDVVKHLGKAFKQISSYK